MPRCHLRSDCLVDCCRQTMPDAPLPIVLALLCTCNLESVRGVLLAVTRIWLAPVGCKFAYCHSCSRSPSEAATAGVLTSCASPRPAAVVPGCARLCRLLRYDVEKAQLVISPTVAPLSSFAEEQSPEMMDRIFEEFNSLSVIYRRPSQAFVKVPCCTHPPPPLPPRTQSIVHG